MSGTVRHTCRPRLMNLRDVALKTQTPWPVVHARYQEGTLPFVIVSARGQLWVVRTDWDAWMQGVLARLKADRVAA